MYKWINEIVPEADAALKQLDVTFGDLIAKKGVHYGSNIAYLSAKIENDDGNKQNYDFVIKYDLAENVARPKLRTDVLFRREIEVYTKLLPNFRKLEIKNSLEPVQFLPRCYKTEITNDQEVIIFEDLRKAGFVMRNKGTPMNLEHIKMILECYGKWHALSFALKDQMRQEYDQVVENWSKVNPYSFLIQSHIGDWINIAHEKFLDILEEMEEIELLNQYKDKIRDLDPKSYFEQHFQNRIEQSVVLHGDCSTNNFMFKYEATDLEQSSPTDVKILDFQASHLGSPVFDLSFFIYTVSSENQLEFIRELLENYYTSFANHMTRMGSDPRKTFSFSDLAWHWEKYSIVGAYFNPFVVALSLSSEEQAPDIANEQDFRKWLEVTKTEKFKHRVLAVARSFVYFEFM